METTIIGIEDLESLNYLAEEVLINLRYEGYRYDDEGNDGFPHEESDKNKAAKDSAMWAWLEDLNHNPLEFRENKKLHEISLSEALEMSFEEIKEKYIKKYLPMMRAIMRKDTMDIGYRVAEDVPDEYLDNLMALRWKENLKMWVVQWDHTRSNEE